MNTAARSHGPRWLWLIALLPPLWSSPGRIAADTKTYLSLDPGGLLGGASRLWDADTGLGTVTHQTIGYLLPQGPWWWIADRLGLPDWLTQRWWWSALVATALFGAHRLARELGASPAASAITAIAYGLDPYLFTYVSRISAILVPWAVLPWMIVVFRAAIDPARRSEGRWRWPARFALLVLVAGTVNATAIAFAVAGSVAWLVTEAGAPQRWWPVLWRSAVASLAVSVWWLTALVVQSRQGIEILRFTETYATIRSTALPSELLRGYGYWFSYGGDWMDPWVGATYGLLGRPWYLAMGFGLVVASLVGVTLLRGVARRPAAVMVTLGLALAVGEASIGNSTPWGAAFGRLVEAGPGMVLRSTQRAVPIMTLGLALGLGAFATAAPRIVRIPRRPLVLGAVVLQALPWWTGGIATAAITRGAVPNHWDDVVSAIGSGVDHRVWETPGADFASYRWGGTVDPVLVGLTDRPVVARELIPLGTDHAADVLSEIERRIAENTLDPASVATLARLMAVDTVVARNDLQFERYALARPDDVTERLDAAPGLTRTFTGPMATHDEYLIDEQTYGGVPGIGIVPAVAVWEVDDPVPVLSVRSGQPLVVHGSAATLVALAEQGLIDGTEVILDGDSTLSAGRIPSGAWTVLGDSNRSEDRRWYSVAATLGATRAVGETTDDPTLQSLAVVEPGRETVSETEGGMALVSATSYGSPAVLSAEDRPEHAVDGDPFTAWRGAALEGTAGLVWEAALAEVSSPSWVDLLQPITGERGRWITRVRLTSDGPDGPWSTVVELGDESRSGTGQRITLGGRAIDRFRIDVLGDSVGPLPGYGSAPGVGFAEVTFDGVASTTEWIRLAADPRTGADGGRTTVVLDRRRIDPSTANRFDPEPFIARRFSLSAPAEFSLIGAWARSAHAADAAVRRSSPSAVGVTGLMWLSEFDPLDPWLEIDLDRGAEEQFEIVVATGGLYSAVGEVTVRDGAGTEWSVVPDRDGRVQLDLTEVSGDRLHVSLRDITPRTTVDRFTERARVLPVGVVDAGPIVRVDPWPGPTCRTGVVAVDGADVPVRLLADGRLVGCVPLRITAGLHEVSTTAGHRTGIDVDRLLLDTGGVTSSTTVRPLGLDRTDTSVSAEGEFAPGDWLVFAESESSGWVASIDGVDLGEPLIAQGYGMAWPIDRTVSGKVDIRWTPQRSVDAAILTSAFMLVVIGGLAIGRRGSTVPGDVPTSVERTPGDLDRRRRWSFVLLAVTSGPAAVVAPLVARLVRPGRSWWLAAPFAAMWVWTSARQVRWDPPIDLRWPASAGWAQWLVVAVVAGCCWKALTDD